MTGAGAVKEDCPGTVNNSVGDEKYQGHEVYRAL